MKSEVTLVIQVKLPKDMTESFDMPEVMEKVRLDIAQGLIINPKHVWIKEVLSSMDVSMDLDMAES
tara:strand:+ start:2173 stop:2370 length:198 start_codon:yes stop_codon:yes gene_type:complete